MKKLMLLASLLMFTAAAGEHLVSTYTGTVRGAKDHRASRYVLNAWLVLDWNAACEATDDAVATKLANAQLITVTREGELNSVSFSCTVDENGEPALTLLESGDSSVSLSMGYEVDGGWKAFDLTGAVRRVRSAGANYYLPVVLKGNDVKYGEAATDAVADIGALTLRLNRREFHSAAAVGDGAVAYAAAVDSALLAASALADRRTR